MLMSLLTLLHGLISMNQSPGKQCITSITSSVLTENRMMWFRIIIFIIMALTFMIVHDLKLFLPQDCFFKDFLIILEINGQCCLNMKLLLWGWLVANALLMLSFICWFQLKPSKKCLSWFCSPYFETMHFFVENLPWKFECFVPNLFIASLWLCLQH